MSKNSSSTSCLWVQITSPVMTDIINIVTFSFDLNHFEVSCRSFCFLSFLQHLRTRSETTLKRLWANRWNPEYDPEPKQFFQLQMALKKYLWNKAVTWCSRLLPPWGMLVVWQPHSHFHRNTIHDQGLIHNLLFT